VSPFFFLGRERCGPICCDCFVLPGRPLSGISSTLGVVFLVSSAYFLPRQGNGCSPSVREEPPDPPFFYRLLSPFPVFLNSNIQSKGTPGRSPASSRLLIPAVMCFWPWISPSPPSFSGATSMALAPGVRFPTHGSCPWFPFRWSLIIGLPALWNGCSRSFLDELSSAF